MSGNGREALEMSGSGQETLWYVREWLGGPPGFLGVVVKTSGMSGSGRVALRDVREWS